MVRQWVVFICDGIELMRYTLVGECEGEREETISLLAYENDISEDEIECYITTG